MHQLPVNLLNADQLLIQLQTVIERCYQTAESFFKCSFARPQVQLNLRGYNAGTATPQKNLLRFNKQLLLANQQHFLKYTVPHEVAHLIAYQIFGLTIKPHGKEWQLIMQQVYQLPAERCHHYTVARKPKRYFIYQCPCNQQHPLTIRRHNAIQQGTRYICKGCKQTLTYTHKINYQ
ncbi:SprT family zinc-dependent metalloprotease [Entomomonas asaccharolytica]|uniref:SprT family zinc-dependent metalloprotease n=1 Tax=Entomomonas asaccharolytica TaxID=2785331 RepID=A0A974ND88_9GAMM|nr:SprT family zinc-dependent metalloprotease [Entomomonas asaccharolytica]QQP84626.1 SprT family zinc-dependent metalloprotease [Entomomonas asaccharolytica]